MRQEARPANLEAAAEPICVKVLRTKFDVLPIAAAGAMAERQYRASLRRKALAGRLRSSRGTSPGQLTTD